MYLLFYLVIGFALLFLNNNLSKAIITLMNIVVVLVPMIGTIFGIMYYYSSREFTELLLAQPIKRRTIFVGQYLGIAMSLSFSLLVGLGIPFMAYGLFQSGEIWNFGLLLIVGTFLTFIFVALAFAISLRNENKIKGFDYGLITPSEQQRRELVSRHPQYAEKQMASAASSISAEQLGTLGWSPGSSPQRAVGRRR